MELNNNRIWETRRTKMEIKMPQIQWEQSWKFLKTRGLSGEQKSFLMKMLHNILPTKQRLFKMNLSDSPLCDLCNCQTMGDLPHIMLECDYNSVVNDWIVGVLLDLDSNLLQADIKSHNIVCLDLPLDSGSHLSVTWFLSTIFASIWKSRQARRPPSLWRIKSSAEADLMILKNTQYSRDADHIKRAMNFVF